MKLERYVSVVVATIATLATACASRPAPQAVAAPVVTSETHVNAAAWQVDDENKPRVGKAQRSGAAPADEVEPTPLGTDKSEGAPRRDDGRGTSFSGYK